MFEENENPVTEEVTENVEETTEPVTENILEQTSEAVTEDVAVEQEQVAGEEVVFDLLQQQQQRIYRRHGSRLHFRAAPPAAPDRWRASARRCPR